MSSAGQCPHTPAVGARRARPNGGLLLRVPLSEDTPRLPVEIFRSARLTCSRRLRPLDLRLRVCALRVGGQCRTRAWRACASRLVRHASKTMRSADAAGSYGLRGKEGEGVLVAALPSERSGGEDALARLTGKSLRNARQTKRPPRRSEAAFSPGGLIRPPRADAWFAAASRISSC